MLLRRVSLEVVLIIGAFKGGARWSQAHIRENATTLVVNRKKWEL